MRRLFLSIAPTPITPSIDDSSLLISPLLFPEAKTIGTPSPFFALFTN